MAKEILQITNTDVITDIKFKHETLMSECSKERLINEYNELIKLKKNLFQTREKVRELENLFSIKQKEWNSKLVFFEPIFEVKEKEYVTNTINLSVKGETVNVG